MKTIERVYALFNQYHNTHQESGVKKLKEFIQQKFGNVEQIILVIDNSIENDLEIKYNKNYHFLSGDDSSYEFSGWDKGIKYIERYFEPKEKDAFILANDTFHRNYGDEYLNYFYNKVIIDCINNNKIYGYIDGYPQPIQIFGLTIQHWIRTSLIILNYKTLKELSPLAIPFSNEELFSENYEEFFHKNIKISENYKQYIKTWLFGEEDKTGIFKEKWHSQRPLTKDNFEFFKGKTRAIFCEHYFSARAKEKGIEIVGGGRK